MLIAIKDQLLCLYVTECLYIVVFGSIMILISIVENLRGNFVVISLLLSYTKMVFIYDSILRIAISIVIIHVIYLLIIIIILIHEMRMFDIFAELLKQVRAAQACDVFVIVDLILLVLD